MTQTQNLDLIFWRSRGGILWPRIFGPPELIAAIESRTQNGHNAARPMLSTMIPIGAVAWSDSDRGPWHWSPELREWQGMSITLPQLRAMLNRSLSSVYIPPSTPVVQGRVTSGAMREWLGLTQLDGQRVTGESQDRTD